MDKPKEFSLLASGKNHGFLDTILPRMVTEEGLHVIEYSAYARLRKALEYYAQASYMGRGPIQELNARGKIAIELGKKILENMPDNEIDHERRDWGIDVCDPARGRTTQTIGGVELIVNIPLTTNEIREVMFGYKAAQVILRATDKKK